MNIFDAHISGALSVSASAEISNNLLISGNLTVLGSISGSVSGNITNADTASYAPNYALNTNFNALSISFNTLTSSFNTLTSSFSGFTSSYNTGSFTGSFNGDGLNLYNIPASGITGLNLSQIADGTATASISQTNGFNVNTNINVSGSILPSVHVGDNVSEYSLGSPTNAWHHLYISTGSIKFVDDLGLEQGRITINPNSGQFNILSTSGLTESEIAQIEAGNIPSSSLTDINIKSLNVNQNIFVSGSVTSSVFTGSFIGDGTNLYNIPASGVTGLNLTQIADGSATASISNTNGLRVNSNTEITGSLNITGSISLNGVPVGTGKLDETTFNSYTSSNDLTSSTQNNRLTSLETSTGSLNTFTGSIDTTIKNKLDTESVISGSVQVEITGTTGYSTFSSSISTSIDLLSSSVATTTNNLSSSVATTTLNLKNRVDSVETSTGSLNSFTSSINTTIKDKMNADGVLSGSITFDISVIPGFTGLTNTVSSSISSSVSELSGSLTVTVTNLSSSLTNTDENQNNRITGLETASGSLNSFTSSINTTIKSKLNTEGVISGSVQVNLTDTTGYSTFSSSIATTDLNQNNRLDSIEGKTGSYATTGSNRFNGNQTITGSLVITQNLQVLGSSSIVYSTASQLIVEDNIIVVNASYPAERFAGIEVHDSGSNGSVTASLFWDGLNNRWIYRNTSDAHYGGAMFIAGPRNTGSLGDEPGLTSGKLPKSIGGDHIGDSIMSEFSGSIAISGSLIITGSILSLGTSLVSGSSQISFNGITDKPTLVSGSSQIDHNATTNYDSNKHIDHTAVSITAGAGLTGGGDISTTRTINVGAGNGITVNADDIAIDTSSSTFTTGVKTKLNTEGVISGSAQVTGLSNSQLTNSAITIAGTSTSLGGTISAATILSGVGVVSGSAQLTSTFVQKAGDTMTGQLIVGSTGTGNSPTLRVNNSTATSFNHSIEAFSSNMTAGQTNLIVVGKTGTTKNAGYIGYNFSSAGSNDNYVSLGHWGADNLLRVYGDGTVYMGTVTTGVWNGTAIANAYLANSSFHIGTTSITLGRASASQTLTGVSIDGNSATVTNGVYVNTNQTITGQKTFQEQSDDIAVILDSTNAAHATRFRYRKNGIDYWSLDARGSGESDALNLYRYYSGNWYVVASFNHSNSATTFSGAISASNLSGTNTGDETKARINALAITTVGTIDSGVWNGSSIGTAYTAAKVTAVNAGTGVGVDTTTGSVTVSIGQSVATSAVPTFKALVLTSDTDSRVLKLRELGTTSGNIIQFQDSAGTNKWEIVGRSNTDATPFYIYKNDGTNTGYIFSISGGGIPNFHTALTIGGSTAKSISNSSYSTTFSSVTSVTVTHSLGTKDVAVFVYDSSDNMFWPSSIVTTSTSVVTITFASSRSGRVVVVR